MQEKNVCNARGQSPRLAPVQNLTLVSHVQGRIIVWSGSIRSSLFCFFFLFFISSFFLGFSLFKRVNYLLEWSRCIKQSTLMFDKLSIEYPMFKECQLRDKFVSPVKSLDPKIRNVSYALIKF